MREDLFDIYRLLGPSYFRIAREHLRTDYGQIMVASESGPPACPEARLLEMRKHSLILGERIRHLRVLNMQLAIAHCLQKNNYNLPDDPDVA